MKRPYTACCALALGSVLCSTALATTATSLASFGGIEEPAVIYDPNTATFTSDSYVNITDQGGGMIRMELRYRKNQWWDGDRTTTSTDRQRAEIKVLGPRQKPGETFEYRSTWRTDPSMVVGNKFCHITQVKGYGGGDIDPPLVTTTLSSGGSVAVRYDSGTMTGLSGVRSFTWNPNEWKTVGYRLTTSSVDGAKDGALLVSVNGDSFVGIQNVDMYRPGAPEYQPKWGLYRGLDNNQPFGDDYMEHKDISATKLTSGPPPPPTAIAFEAESLTRTLVGGSGGPSSDASASGGVWVAFNATGVGSYIDYTIPNLPAGTYNLLFRYKTLNTRGILSLSVDGVTLGSNIDQYTAKSSFPEPDMGVLRFAAAGNHTIRLTCMGKNPLSTVYTLAADKFSFVKDTTAPELDVPDDITVEATSPSGATVAYDASATDDKDGSVPVTLSPASGSLFPLGTTVVTASATDFGGNTGTAKFNVIVVDTTAPIIDSVTPSTTVISRTDHRMYPVSIAVAAHDIADSAPVARIVSVSSNEPITGTGNGDIGPDWDITGDLTVNLRGERAGAGTGRIYTITVEVRDASGNATTQTTQVSVPRTTAK